MIVSFLQMGAKSSKYVPKPFTSVRRGRGNTVRIINVLPASLTSPASPASHDLLPSPEYISSASEGGLQMVDVDDGSSNDEMDFFQTYVDDSEDSYAEVITCSYIYIFHNLLFSYMCACYTTGACKESGQKAFYCTKKTRNDGEESDAAKELTQKVVSAEIAIVWKEKQSGSKHSSSFSFPRHCLAII